MRSAEQQRWQRTAVVNQPVLGERGVLAVVALPAAVLASLLLGVLLARLFAAVAQVPAAKSIVVIGVAFAIPESISNTH